MSLILIICSITIGVVSAQNFQCPPTGIHAFKYPGSCQRFIRCIMGSFMVQECAPATYFDIVRGQCNKAAEANCNPCRDNPSGQLRFTRDSLNCARFSMCIGQSHSESTCGSGLYFNLVSNTCALSHTVNCTDSGGGGGDPTTTTTTTTTPRPPDGTDPDIDGLCDKDSNFEAIASISSCENFTICSCGFPNRQTCPSGLIYDVRSRQCNTRQQGACLQESVAPCPPNVVDIFAHPYDCRHQVLCINGRPILEACAPGLEVNRRTSRCDFPHIAQCSSRSALTYTERMTEMSFT